MKKKLSKKLKPIKIASFTTELGGLESQTIEGGTDRFPLMPQHNGPLGSPALFKNLWQFSITGRGVCSQIQLQGACIPQQVRNCGHSACMGSPKDSPMVTCVSRNYTPPLQQQPLLNNPSFNGMGPCATNEPGGCIYGI